MENEISWEKAVQLCIEIEQRNRKLQYTPNGMMCYFCAHFSKGEMSKRCIGGEGHRGCYQVSARFDRELSNQN